MLARRLSNYAIKHPLHTNLILRNSLFLNRCLHISNRYKQINFNYPLIGLLTSLSGIFMFLYKNQKLPECLDEIDESKVYNITIEKYKALHRVIGNYLKDPAYVYDLCRDSDGKWWLVIMKRTPYTITNEQRNGMIDATKAEHLGNKFKVVLIVDIDNPTITKSSLKHTIATNNFVSHMHTIYLTTIYRVGMNVSDKNEKFDMNLDRWYGPGVYFYVDVFCALQKGFKWHQNYSSKERYYNHITGELEWENNIT